MQTTFVEIELIGESFFVHTPHGKYELGRVAYLTEVVENIVPYLEEMYLQSTAPKPLCRLSFGKI